MMWRDHLSGVVNATRWLRRGGLRILMYHRFPDSAVESGQLARQCEHFRRYYRLLTLDQAAEHLQSGKPFPPYSLALTVDDGYRDFLGAAEVIHRYEIPVTMYLAVDFLDRREWLWTDLVRACFNASPLREVSIPFEGLPAELLPVSSEGARRFNTLAKRIPEGERRRMVAQLGSLLEVNLPEFPPEPHAPLTWDEVRRLSRRGVTFGAHTMSHPILTRLESAAALRHEIEGSRLRVERELSMPVRHFCYPNGQPEDISQEVLAATRAAGFLTAVTTSCGINYPRTDPLRLLRFGMEPSLSGFYFESVTAGWRKT